ncbi:unnamed protein product [Pocillopora meandrina]|uniref:C-type lectin domain-containing protein n=1 Tax=Pocillopora meandrina TaxID=46732 RepID=A0AAU9XRQ2_9CNID|nr:unnamed protein product [Pocillopora meandrina]
MNFLCYQLLVGGLLLITANEGQTTAPRKARQLDEFFDIPGSCPQGWIGHKGSCYLPYVNGKTWQEANGTCREMDSHLALSRSVTENGFIAEQVARPEARVWIGLKRNRGEFFWSDGTKSEFTNWAKREPKDASVTGRDCVTLLSEDIFHSWENECSWGQIISEY